MKLKQLSTWQKKIEKENTRTDETDRKLKYHAREPPIIFHQGKARENKKSRTHVISHNLKGGKTLKELIKQIYNINKLHKD